MNVFRPLLALGLALLLGTAQAQVRPDVKSLGIDAPKSALFAGNSFFYFNNSVHDHLRALARAATPSVNLRAVSVTISASSFGWHDMESYFRPGALSSYSFTADNRIVTNRFDRLFDVAVIMDCSQCPIHPEFKAQFHQLAKAHIDTIRRHGAQPVLFMSWAYADAPEMTQPLADAYTKAGNDNRALVVPVGLAFARVVQQHPQINLYHTDKRHPSLAGTYLASLMLYGALYGQSPEGLSYTAGLDADVARTLQRVGWQTLQDYYRP